MMDYESTVTVSQYSSLLTIAIPTFNRPSNLIICIDSILTQIEKNVNILISDNSTNNVTEDLIKERFSGNSLIGYIKNEQNIGPDANFLQCLRLSKGRFTLILGDDDVLVPGALKEIVSTLEANLNAPLIFLNHKTWGGYIGARKHNGVPINNNLFISQVAYALTYVSALVFNTTFFREIERPERFFGSMLLQTNLVMEILGRHDGAIITKNYCVSAQALQGAFGSYDVYGVFASNWKAILKHSYLNGHITYFTMRRAFSKTIFPFLTKMTILFRQDDDLTNFISSRKILFKATNTYFFSWLLLYPATLIPSKLMTYINRFISHYSRVRK